MKINLHFDCECHDYSVDVHKIGSSMQLYIFKCTCAVDIHPLAGAIQGYVYDKQFDTRLKNLACNGRLINFRICRDAQRYLLDSM